jgi:L-alanine-DL-glutamate epimerase-like enolase superfamily enzyme
MKVTALETIRSAEHPNLLWVQVVTDEGLVGLGETFYGPAAAEGHIHGTIAPYLIGKDATNIEAHQAHLTGYIGFVGASAEMRGRSAVDIALWDILGQAKGMPICDLLGGRVREKIKVYNTCAGYSYVQTKATQGTSNFGLDAKKGQYEDLDAFLNRADELALSLLEMGIDAMKIWPLDYAAEASSGYRISPTAWTSPTSCIRCGAGRRRSRSPARWSPTARCGSRIPCSWITCTRSARWRGRHARPSPSARHGAGAPISATCSSSRRFPW